MLDILTNTFINWFISWVGIRVDIISGRDYWPEITNEVGRDY
jgi:hypothetical protein